MQVRSSSVLVFRTKSGRLFTHDDLKKRVHMISQSRFEQRFKSMTAIAQKVYAAVPMVEPWSPSFICSEMQRLGSSTRDSRVVEGCLNTLKEAGLVLEPSRRVFIRSPIKPDPIIPPQKDQAMTNAITLTASKTDKTEKKSRAPIAILSELATRLKKLSDDMEIAALEIDDYITSKDADAEKLKQLQVLLNSLR